MGCAQLSCGSKRPAPCSGATRRSNPRGLRATILRVEAVARAALAHNPVWSLAGPPVRRMRRTPQNAAGAARRENPRYLAGAALLCWMREAQGVDGSDA